MTPRRRRFLLPVLGALAAVGLWYAFVWGINHAPLFMADLLIYGLCPAVLAFTFGSLGWMLHLSRVDAHAFAAKQAQWAAEDTARNARSLPLDDTPGEKYGEGS